MLFKHLFPWSYLPHSRTPRIRALCAINLIIIIILLKRVDGTLRTLWRSLDTKEIIVNKVACFLVQHQVIINVEILLLVLIVAIESRIKPVYTPHINLRCNPCLFTKRSENTPRPNRIMSILCNHEIYIIFISFVFFLILLLLLLELVFPVIYIVKVKLRIDLMIYLHFVLWIQ